MVRLGLRSFEFAVSFNVVKVHTRTWLVSYTHVIQLSRTL